MTVSLPVLIAVDEDPRALRDLMTQLVQRYGGEYRVEGLAHPDDALRTLTELHDAGAEVPLVLAGLSGPDAFEAELFDHARRLHPHAKRVLLVPPGAWADDDVAKAIRGSTVLGRIDHHMLKPAGVRDEVFHAAVAGFLLDWALERRIVPHTVHVVGEAWSGRAHELREVFERCAIPHAFHLAESDEGRRLVAEAGPGAKLPLMALPDGRILSDPSNAELAEAAGAPTDFEDRRFDLVIVGAGPAGLSAAVYGASEGLQVLVIDSGGIGGQARSSSLIRNYLGFATGVSGNRLAEQAYEQASAFGASFVFMHRATALTRVGERLEVSLSEARSVGARAVLLATGARYRRLGVPSIEALNGAGVFYGGPASEAPALRGSDVYIAGGANSAGQAALHLARYAGRVTLVVRAGSLEAGMSDYLIRAIRAAPNVEVRTGTTVVGGGGDGWLQELVLRNGATGEENEVAADALFVLIGARPRTDWLPVEIARDEQGFVLTGDEVTGGWSLARHPFALETSMPGVFAAGDARHSSVKRVAVAVGEGSLAVQAVEQLLATEQPAQVNRHVRIA